MLPTKIETLREFFDYVVQYDVQHLVNNQTDLRAAYHACTSLLSLRDWVFEANKGQKWSLGGPFTSKEKLQAALEALEKKIAIVTDIANASKHMILDKNRRRTNLWGNANTEVQFSGGAVGEDAVGEGPVGGGTGYIVVKIDNNFHDVVDSVSSVHQLWTRVFAANGW